MAALAAVLAACGQPGGAPPTRPNVVLVSLDTLRADALGSHGSGHDTSPNLDALAARGVRCADALFQESTRSVLAATIKVQ